MFGKSVNDVNLYSCAPQKSLIVWQFLALFLNIINHLTLLSSGNVMKHNYTPVLKGSLKKRIEGNIMSK